MKSITTLFLKPLHFLISLISPSHSNLDKPLPLEEIVSENQTTPASLDDLDLSPRVLNSLWKADIRNTETLVSMSDESLLNIRGFGVKALAELKERLASYNLSNHNTVPLVHEEE